MKQFWLVSLLLLLTSVQAASQAFQLVCNLKGQIRILKQSRGIDSTCSKQGQGASSQQTSKPRQE